MSSLIENLLYQGEGTALDFKEKQYLFHGATDEQKSELFKDILAFANSWRQDEAYIVIGVKTVVGGKHIPVGTDEHFDDAQLQQFINSKTNRNVKLAYEVYSFEGKKIGIIRIQKQERPIYAVKNYGKVNKEVVYYRLGSSTAIANPDVIADMGKDALQKKSTPIISLQFANPQNRQELGSCVEIISIAYENNQLNLPDYKIQQPRTLSGLNISLKPESDNADYWRDKEEYVRLTKLLKPVAFVIYNQSNLLAENVRVEIINNFADSIKILQEIPTAPFRNRFNNIARNFRPIGQAKSPIDIIYHGDGWTLTVNFGNVQPKSSIWLNEPFFLGSTQQEELKIEAFIYADNIPEPQKVNLTAKFVIENKPALIVSELNNIPPFDN